MFVLRLPKYVGLFITAGKVLVKLAACDDDIQAAVMLHPSRITEDEIKGKLSSCLLYRNFSFNTSRIVENW